MRPHIDPVLLEPRGHFAAFQLDTWSLEEIVERLEARDYKCRAYDREYQTEEPKFARELKLEATVGAGTDNEVLLEVSEGHWVVFGPGAFVDAFTPEALEEAFVEISPAAAPPLP